VQLELRQVTPKQAATSVIRGEADIAIATESLDEYADLATFPCFSWRHIAIAPADHTLAKLSKVSLSDIADHPIITYGSEFSGRSQIDAAFERQSLEADIRLTAMDADVIKTYVHHGLGVGVLSEMAFAPATDRGLVLLAGSHDLFQPSVTRIALQRGALLHAYAYRFVEMFAPSLVAASVRDEVFNRPGKTTKPGTERTRPIPDFSDFSASIRA
jgi:DNA-binding transcriptional LysR family regulator